MWYRIAQVGLIFAGAFLTLSLFMPHQGPQQDSAPYLIGFYSVKLFVLALIALCFFIASRAGRRARRQERAGDSSTE